MIAIKSKISKDKATKSQIYSFEVDGESFDAFYYTKGKYLQGEPVLEIMHNGSLIGTIETQDTKNEFTAKSLRITAWINRWTYLGKSKRVGIEVNGEPVQGTLADPEIHVKYGRLALILYSFLLLCGSYIDYAAAATEYGSHIVGIIASATSLSLFLFFIILIIEYKRCAKFALLAGIVLTIIEIILLFALPNDYGSKAINWAYLRVTLLYVFYNSLKWKHKQEESPFSSEFIRAIFVAAGIAVWIVCISTYGEIYKIAYRKANPTITYIVMLTDPRDEQTYKTTEINGLIWMAENLNYEIEDSWCYDNNPENCNKYGRLYNWYSAMEVCPPDWRLPTGYEWEDLGKSIDYGKSLKAKYGWNKGGNGTDEYGFAALPGGERYAEKNFQDAGNKGHWWTATSRSNGTEAYKERMGYDYDFIMGDYHNKEFGNFSVRCVKDK